MTAPMAPRGRGDLASVMRLWPQVRPDRRWLWLALVMTPLGVLANLVQPLLLKEAIDGHIASGQLEGLGEVALAFLGVVTLGFATRSLGLYALQHASLRTLARLRRFIFSHVVGQGRAFFDRRTTGALMTRTTNDVEAIYESLAFGAVNLASDGLLILGILVSMFWLDWRLTLVAFACSPVIVLVVEIFRRRLRVLSLVIRKSLSRLNGFFAERVYGMSVVQLYGAEESTRSRFRGLAYEYLDAYRRSNWWDAALYAIMDGMSSLSIGFMIWYGAGRFSEGAEGVTLGLLVAFVDYLGNIFIPIRDFSARVASLQRAGAGLERIFGLLDVHMSIGGGAPLDGRVRGEVVFDRVGFRYREAGAPVLQDVSFQIAPGEVVALVGATGSGKSTIARLLTRTYEGYTGSVRLDGRSLDAVEPSSLRRAVCVVQQDVFLFEATVAENVHLWARDVSEDGLAMALERARVSDFLAARGLDAHHGVDERGGNLSSGEKQLVAIARAMARPAPVVILDEATASVDSETEHLVDAAMEALFEERTVLVIAHRLSTVQKADRILVLDGGRLVEQGDHRSLVEAGGLYAHLVERGFESVDAAADDGIRSGS